MGGRKYGFGADPLRMYAASVDDPQENTDHAQFTLTHLNQL